MSSRITRIESAGPTLRARRIFFEGDPEPRTTAAAVVKKLGIVEGLDVDRAAFERSLAEEELPLAKERALQLLGYRERSAHELRTKLRDSGFPTDVAEAVVARYVEVELVDDERFASAWTRSRRSSGFGDRRIRRELTEKGVDPVLADAVLESEEADSEVDRAIDSLRGRTPRDRADSQRLIKRLLTRGFSVGAARAAVERLGVLSDGDVEGQFDGDTVDDLQ